MKATAKQHLKHGFAPVFDAKSKILILGSFPSVKSREENFYYGNKQNRFWPLLADIYKAALPENTEEKKRLILANGLAIWDIIAECDIYGSADSTIENVTVSDLEQILQAAKIDKIIANGATAGRLYKKYSPAAAKYKITVLPSTSPANAAYSFDKLKSIWSQALQGK